MAEGPRVGVQSEPEWLARRGDIDAGGGEQEQRDDGDGRDDRQNGQSAERAAQQSAAIPRGQAAQRTGTYTWSSSPAAASGTTRACSGRKATTHGAGAVRPPFGMTAEHGAPWLVGICTRTLPLGSSASATASSSTVLPRKSRTNGVAGSSYSSLAVPSCSNRPFSITPTRLE